VAASASVDLDRWQRGFDELMLTIGARFARVEPRRRARAFVRGLLAGLPRTNCWTIAEHAGEQSPRGMQRLLKSAVVDDGGLRDDLRGYVTGHLGDLAAVLVVDETGDVKKGTATAGVQRQYTGPGGSRTRRSRSTWPTRRRGGTRSSTGRSTCPGPGRMTRAGARPRTFPGTRSSRRSRPWPW